MKPFLGWQNYDNICTQISRSTEFLRWNKSDVIENAAIFQLNTGHLLNRIKSSLRLNLVKNAHLILKTVQDLAFLSTSQ